MKKFSVRKKIPYNPKKPVEKESGNSGKNPSKNLYKPKKTRSKNFSAIREKFLRLSEIVFFGTDPGTEPGQILPVPARAGTR
jgi:hypothetical protein